MLKNPPKWYSPHLRIEGVVDDPNPREVPNSTTWTEESKDNQEKLYRLAFAIAEKLDELAEIMRDPSKGHIVNRDMLIDFMYVKAEQLRNKVEFMKPINPLIVKPLFEENLKLAEKMEVTLGITQQPPIQDDAQGS